MEDSNLFLFEARTQQNMDYLLHLSTNTSACTYRDGLTKLDIIFGNCGDRLSTNSTIILVTTEYQPLSKLTNKYQKLFVAIHTMHIPRKMYSICTALCTI